MWPIIYYRNTYHNYATGLDICIKLMLYDYSFLTLCSKNASIKDS